MVPLRATLVSLPWSALITERRSQSELINLQTPRSGIQLTTRPAVSGHNLRQTYTHMCARRHGHTLTHVHIPKYDQRKKHTHIQRSLETLL